MKARALLGVPLLAAAAAACSSSEGPADDADTFVEAFNQIAEQRQSLDGEEADAFDAEAEIDKMDDDPEVAGSVDRVAQYVVASCDLEDPAAEAGGNAEARASTMRMPSFSARRAWSTASQLTTKSRCRSNPMLRATTAIPK